MSIAHDQPEVLRRNRPKHVVLLQENSNFELCLGVLPRGVKLLCQEHADGTEVLTKSLVSHVVLLR